LFQEELNPVLKKLSRKYEIVYIDDGSTDSSLAVLKELKKKFSNISIVSLKENKGQSAALRAGFKVSRGKWIITLDADLQNPPQDIFKLLPFRENFDFITGVRNNRKDASFRIFSASVAKFFRWVLLKDNTTDTGCSLRMFKREIADAIPFVRNFHRFFSFLVKIKGFSVKEVNVSHRPRKYGKSKCNFLKRICESILDLCNVHRLKKHES